MAGKMSRRGIYIKKYKRYYKISELTWAQARALGIKKKRWERAVKISKALKERNLKKLVEEAKQYFLKKKEKIRKAKNLKKYVAYVVWFSGKSYAIRREIRVYFYAPEGEEEELGRQFLAKAVKDFLDVSIETIKKEWHGAYDSVGEVGEKGEVEEVYEVEAEYIKDDKTIDYETFTNDYIEDLEKYIEEEIKEVGTEIYLDYDNTTKSKIEKEAKKILKLLRDRGYKSKIEVWQSSSKNYHIKVRDNIQWLDAIDILVESDCSYDYKKFVLKKKEFVVRIAKKKKAKGRPKQKPILIFTLE